jgi:DNA polymerase-3 subunit epsilon
MKKIWVDVETTGLLCGKDRIIELAAIYEDDVFHRYCKPFDSKPENFGFIEGLTGITWKYLEENGCSDQKLYREFNTWICKIINQYDRLDKAVFCAYNAHFDSDFIRALFNRNGNKFYGSFFFSARLDVMTTVAENMDKLYTLPNLKNETVCNHLGIELKAHSALEDIKATKELYERLLK